MERKETTAKHYSRNKGFSCPHSTTITT